MGAPMGGPPPGMQMAGPPQGGPMAPMGGAPMVPAGGAPGGGAPGQIRNPIMVFLIGYICCFYAMFQLKEIEGELRRYTGKGDSGSILWFIFPLIPLLGMGELVGAARAKAGTATQGNGSFIMYWLLGMYFIPKDANEVWERLGVQAKLVRSAVPGSSRRRLGFSTALQHFQTRPCPRAGGTRGAIQCLKVCSRAARSARFVTRSWCS